MGAQHLGHDQHQVGRGRPARQRPVEPDADDVGHRLVERLAEQDRLRLDAAHAIAEDAEAIDHRRVRIGADERVGVGDPASLAVIGVGDHGGQELEVDLVDDPRPRGHDPQVAESGLRPAQQLIALAVAVVLALDIEGERAGRPELVDLDRVIDDEVGRDERIDLGRVAAEVGHRITHDRQVDDRRDAGEVLEEDPGRHERDLRLGRRAGAPRQERLHVLRPDHAAARVAQQVLEQDLDRDREAGEVDPVGHGLEPVVPVVGAADPQRRRAP